MPLTEYHGEFWATLGADRPHRPGILTVEEEHGPSVTTQGELFPLMEWHENPGGGYTGVPIRSNPVVTVCGTDSLGTPLTVFRAVTVRHSGLPLGLITQRLLGTWAVVGPHLEDESHPISELRFQMQEQAAWRASLYREERSRPVAIQGLGLLALREVHGVLWWHYEAEPQRDFQCLNRDVVRPISSLVSLMSGASLVPTQIHIKPLGNAVWCPVLQSSHVDNDAGRQRNALISPEDINAENMAAWLAVSTRLGAMPAIVSSMQRTDLTLEGQVLELTTAAEGIHRRLYPDKLGLSEEVAQTAKLSAIDAVRRSAPEAVERLQGLISHLGELGYGARLRDLAREAEPIIPDVIGRPGRWRGLVTKARNDFAHKFDRGELQESDVDAYLTVAHSLLWLLRLVLLRNAGLSTELLRERHRSNGAYRSLMWVIEVDRG